MSPRPPLPRKVGVMNPPAPMGAPPLVIAVCFIKTNITATVDDMTLTSLTKTTTSK